MIFGTLIGESSLSVQICMLQPICMRTVLGTASFTRTSVSHLLYLGDVASCACKSKYRLVVRRHSLAYQNVTVGTKGPHISHKQSTDKPQGHPNIHLSLSTTIQTPYKQPNHKDRSLTFKRAFKILEHLS